MCRKRWYVWEAKEKMKVFISWSGEKSFEVAKVLKEWIPCVIQDIEPYFSSEDIDKGARWSTDIAKELEEASFGILCVTKDNLESQWLNFEAGALSKAIDKAKVCPFLFDLKPSDISNSPILQFQMTNVDRDDIYKLFGTINNCLEENRLDETRLEKMFSAFWSQMDKAFKNIENMSESKDANNKRNQKNQNVILEEMLELLRTQQMLLKSPERILPEDYLKHVLRNNRQFEEEALMRVPGSMIREYESCLDQLQMYEGMLNPFSEDDFNNKIIKDYVTVVHRMHKVQERILERLGIIKMLRR